MKPTPQISPVPRSLHNEESLEIAQPSFPVVDSSYQPTAGAVTAPSPTAKKQAPQLPSFRNLRREVFGAKTDGEYIREAILFGSILAIAAWPIGIMLHQLATMMISPPPGGIW